ncbi:MAG: uracil phosphoribosyltransferase [Saprospiraceae bacterium]|jgi:uracil phosphoribosyltransferase|nr:uracil phosphoribosyltransferase [Saprospirales bacterium]
MIYCINEFNTIANRFLAEMRDVNIQTDRMRFRRNMERLGEVMAYELSKTFQYKPQEVETPLGVAKVQLPTERIVLATILRAGIPFHQGFLNFFDNAENAFVSAYRKHHKDGTFDIHLEYVSCPDLEGAELILIDPMLATGSSMHIVIEELANYGKPNKLHIATAIASKQGLEFIRREHPEAFVWIGAIDEELTGKAYIVPGLGDAGDLAYGAKVQD